MWLILVLFGVFWIVDFRRRGSSWQGTLSTLAIPAVVLVPLAAFGPDWLWKTLMMAYLTLPYWALPAAVMRKPVARAASEVREFDPAHDDVWPELPRLVEDAAAGLEAEGVTRVGTYLEELAAGPTTLTAAYEPPNGTELVMVNGSTNLVMQGTEAEARDTQLHALVGMTFADGRRLAVANTAMTPSGGPETTVERFTSVQDSARLLRIARAYRARWFADARPVSVRGELSPLQFSAERHRLMLEREGARRLYRLDPDGDLYLTPAGALVKAWGLLFPFLQIGAWRLRLRERRILRELGMEAVDGASVPRPRSTQPFDLHGVAAIVFAVLLVLID